MTKWCKFAKLNHIVTKILKPFGTDPVYVEYQYAFRWDYETMQPVEDGGTAVTTVNHYIAIAANLLLDMDQQCDELDISYSEMLRAVQFYNLCLGAYTYGMNLSRAYSNLSITQLNIKYSLGDQPKKRRW